MKKEVSPGVIGGIIAVVVIIIGILAFKTFSQNTDVSPGSPSDIKKYQEGRARDAEIYQRTRGSLSPKMRAMMGKGSEDSAQPAPSQSR